MALAQSLSDTAHAGPAVTSATFASDPQMEILNRCPHEDGHSKGVTKKPASPDSISANFRLIKLVLAAIVLFGSIAILVGFEKGMLDSGPDGGGGLAFAILSPCVLAPCILIVIFDSMALVFKQNYSARI
jgi:hypothetical protein